MAHATTPPAPGLDVVIASHARGLVHELPHALAGDVTGVHKSRVASRRLRETLPLAFAAVSGGGPEHLRRDVRRITRALGSVRELDVTMIVFTTEAKRHPAAATACARMVSAWERERDAAREAMTESLARVDVHALRGRLQALARDVAVAPRRIWGRALESRVRNRASALAALVSSLGAVYVPERLHAVRIAAKKLRYSLEVARDAAGLPCAFEIDTLVKAQDLLGEWHDLQVVQRRIQSVTGSRRGPGARAVATLLQQCDADCRDRHARFLALGPQVLDVCDRVKRRVAAHKMLRMPAKAIARRPALRLTALRRG